MIQFPSICPNCRSTAVSAGLAMANCYTCGWKGPNSELLTVVSDGLTLEEMIDRFAKDLLMVIAANLSKPLGDFLVRWDIVSPDNPSAMRHIIGHAVGDIASGVFEYIVSCAPSEDDEEEEEG